MAEFPKPGCLAKSVRRKRPAEALGLLYANGRHPHLLINKQSYAPD
jgi:hypothetical protein